MLYPLATLPPNKDIDPWVEAMEGLAVPARRNVLRHQFVPPMRPYLYKYFSSNQPYSTRNLRDVIVGSVLRLNSPCSFNDPFELSAHFVMRATEEQKLARYESLVRQQAPHLGWRAREPSVRWLMAATENDLNPTWQRSLAKVRESSGVYCFAGSDQNRLMWGHYASNHKGLCLQFDRAQDVRVLSHAFRVDYVSKLPEIDWVADFHKGITGMLFSKDPCWRYERESRILSLDQAGRYLPFQPQAISRLVFGCRAERAFVDYVEGLVAERIKAGLPPLAVYAAEQHPTKYRLRMMRCNN